MRMHDFNLQNQWWILILIASDQKASARIDGTTTANTTTAHTHAKLLAPMQSKCLGQQFIHGVWLLLIFLSLSKMKCIVRYAMMTVMFAADNGAFGKVDYIEPYALSAMQSETIEESKSADSHTHTFQQITTCIAFGALSLLLFSVQFFCSCCLPLHLVAFPYTMRMKNRTFFPVQIVCAILFFSIRGCFSARNDYNW